MSIFFRVQAKNNAYKGTLDCASSVIKNGENVTSCPSRFECTRPGPKQSVCIDPQLQQSNSSGITKLGFPIF